MSKANHIDWSPAGPNGQSGFSVSDLSSYAISADFSGAVLGAAVAAICATAGIAAAPA